MNLPKPYVEKMKGLLGDQWEAYLESFQEDSFSGLRVNTLKNAPEEFEKISPFPLEKIPWANNGYYYDASIHPAKHPYYYAGLYYIQEPSAMVPASLLPIFPGDKVLDLCAAPGGKSTELAAKLQGDGILVANDISNSRAKGLLKNLELFGVVNAIVLSETPEKLSNYFEEYFDKILVDAPCSGEGMFRKDSSMIKDWEEKGPEYYSTLQRQIILTAGKMLKPGGLLLYSTCTFSPEENEGTIQFLLDQNEEFEVVIPEKYPGFDSGRPEWMGGSKELKDTIRIWPFMVKGEGHFTALLKKKTSTMIPHKQYQCKKVKLLEETIDFFDHVNFPIDISRIEKKEERLYLLPKDMVELKGLRLLRTGLFLGEEKKKRFEPSQALANALKKGQYVNEISFGIEDPRVIKYLKGETIEIDEDKATGWQLVLVDGYPLGWGKSNRGVLKNKYYPGWRWM